MTDGVRIRVRGQVQGVGFRPFIWQLAQRFGLGGSVLNDREGVLIFATGTDLDGFLAAIRSEAPPLSRIDAIETAAHRFEVAPVGFGIAESQGSGAETRVTPDAATCAECLADIRGSDPRRAGYAFTNCTHCGPRFTILRSLPYDRSRTTMAEFAMCAECAAEYADPADRRFHAQPVACAACGPQLRFDTPGDPVAAAAAALLAGAVLAVKGLGGFHLCCDATNAEAISTLRTRKRRPTKPLALMGRWEDIRTYADPSDEEEAALASSAAPIVLLLRAAPLPETLAPGQARLGWMLPYTPLHHLLLDRVQRPLVMTSGNLSGEPQVIGNDEAREVLGALVDGILDHDREIARRLDDSVMRMAPSGPMILRRARGMAPDTLPLPDGFDDAPQVAAFGAHLKSAICLVKNGQALLSHHLGDLDNALTWDEFVKADWDYAALFDHRPEVFACDLHPDYLSSRHAWERAGGAPVEVQHHHAHLAACLAENGWPLDGGAVAGIVLDGLGLGADGSVWGGELLLGDYRGYERRAHLRPAPLMGGDAASREPWRNALARLDQAGLPGVADRLFPEAPRDILRQAAERGVNAPLSSSAGRHFDAVAAILGLSPARQSFEGEAAMALEAVADGVVGPDYAFGTDARIIEPSEALTAMVADLEAGMSVPEIAAGVHAGLAQAFATRARALVRSGEAKAVALSGGCFQNARLLSETLRSLAGVPVLIHARVPANDGGLALGQAVIAAAQSLGGR
ncbi:carbamoyltransferase HypF [Litorisediminicola beolgyonensis]|uniref:Carbamoyltransferase HypF n=1 Tax=Litorisediminicola beolgyonensis TaxID=1173614 RepID=A0ABW3ZL17_9RHOB